MLKKFEWVILIVVISLIAMPVISIAYTDAQVLTTVSEGIEKHSETSKWIMGGVASLLSIILGKLFMLIQENRKTFNQEFHTLNKSLTANYDSVNSKIEGHKLYVANNYTKDTKIEHMMRLQMEPMRVEMKGISSKVEIMQTTLNIIASKLRDR